MGQIPPQGIANGPLASIFSQLQNHYPKGNMVQLVTRVSASDDKDFGIAGIITETITSICPEPWINAISIRSVQQSGGALRYTDYKMNVAKDALTPDVAYDVTTQFIVNGDRYGIVTVQAGPSFWEFVIRRNTAEPVTP